MKPKKCKVCRHDFTPTRPLQVVCSVPCAASLGRIKAEKQEKEAKRVERRRDAETRVRLKTKPQLTKEAQREFNKYVRLRDAGKPCICCGQPLGIDEVGGAYDCGHYRSVGSAPHLRFDERNAHGQRKRCNRYGAGRAVEYRAGLIARYGLQFVESLEADQAPKHYTREDLINIRDTYRRKAKELEKCNQTTSED